MAARDTTRARQAALLLYDLSPLVRTRILARLSPYERSTIEPLLQELAQLGIPRPVDPVLRIWTSVAASPSQPKTDARELAARLDAETVAQCLERCAVLTVARILSIADWPWKAQVLDAMPESRRAAVLMSLRERPARLAPAVKTKLCSRLCEIAAQVRNDTPIQSAMRALLTRLTSRMTALLAWIR